jgi:hypothetical protein
LGQVAAALVDLNFTGLIATLKGLKNKPEEWVPIGAPLVSMIHLERRHGKFKPVIKKALVELDGALFKLFESQRSKWSEADFFCSVGPIQFNWEEVQILPYLMNPPTVEELYLSGENIKRAVYQLDNLPYAKFNIDNMR